MNPKSWSESKLAPWNWFKDEQQSVAPVEISNRSLLARFHQDIDRLFEDTLRTLNMPSLFDTGASKSEMWDSHALLRPSLDIEEKADSYHLSVELPGVSKEDLKLNLSGQVLTISGEKKQHSEEQEKGKYHRIERRYGSFSRTLTLPALTTVS